jgi:hypothetical protein
MLNKEMKIFAMLSEDEKAKLEAAPDGKVQFMDNDLKWNPKNNKNFNNAAVYRIKPQTFTTLDGVEVEYDHDDKVSSPIYIVTKPTLFNNYKADINTVYSYFRDNKFSIRFYHAAKAQICLNALNSGEYSFDEVKNMDWKLSENELRQKLENPKTLQSPLEIAIKIRDNDYSCEGICCVDCPVSEKKTGVNCGEYSPVSYASHKKRKTVIDNYIKEHSPKTDEVEFEIKPILISRDGYLFVHNYDKIAISSLSKVQNFVGFIYPDSDLIEPNPVKIVDQKRILPIKAVFIK